MNRHENAHTHAVSLPVFAIVRGDVMVYIKHASILRPTYDLLPASPVCSRQVFADISRTMLTVQFHTAMLRSKQLVVKKGNCDIACNDRRFAQPFCHALVHETRDH